MKVLWLMLFVVVILSCFVSAWNSTLDLGLQAYWNFDTNANDITENGNNCNNVGADYYASGGILSGFYNFTGVDYMNCGNSSKLRSNITFSYSIWVRPKDLSVDMMAISYPYSRGWYNPYGSWYLNFDENTLRTSTAVNGVPHYADIPNIAQANVWQHIAFTYDGNTIKLYYNGVNVVSTSVSGVILYNEADLSNLSIGTKSINALGMYWIGGIDEIGIWNRSLSSEEVSLLYNNGSGITYTGIECYADEDCGQDGWIDGEFCYNDDIL